MRRMLYVTGLAVLLLATLGCGAITSLADRVTGLGKAPELWSDVPRMDGLAPSDKDMPLFAKVIVRTVVPAILSEGNGTGDWIMFTTDQTADDIKAFYTNERMAEAGWEASDTSTCATGSAEGVTESGVVCVFQKQVGNQYTGLAIIAGEDTATQETNIIFIRAEAEQTPEPAP